MKIFIDVFQYVCMSDFKLAALLFFVFLRQFYKLYLFVAMLSFAVCPTLKQTTNKPEKKSSMDDKISRNNPMLLLNVKTQNGIK